MVGFENDMERGIRKFLTFVELEIASKIFEKVVISKRLKFP